MKKQTTTPTASTFTILKQLCNIIPPGLVSKLAQETGAARQERTFSCWSQTVALMFAHLTHAIGLNDVCDALRMHGTALAGVRGAIPPSRNNLSYANAHRDAELAKALFWRMLDQLQRQTPSFCHGGKISGSLRRFRRSIQVIDTTTLKLIVSCIDWARHRRRKAAAKCHLRLDLQSFLPRFAIVTSAGESDSGRAREMCAGLKAGQIAIFDKAYMMWRLLGELTGRGVYWVTRPKTPLACRVVKRQRRTKDKRIVRDELIELTVRTSWLAHPQQLRRVVAWVEVDGKLRQMTFITNQLSWSAWTVAELYRARWQIEVFFKQIKQTLQLCDFLGQNENAVRWQIWIGLLVHLLLRYLGFVHGWWHSFTRLFTVIRAALWQRWDLRDLLDRYGTAGGSYRMLAQPQQAFLPSFQ